MRLGRPRPRVASITPSWLRVDRAMIFLRSHSTMADRPAISIVSEEMKRRLGRNEGQRFRKGKNRNKRKTPAVTRVEECTSADTGVGAAMAAGSQLEKGIWALLVIAAMVRQKAARELRENLEEFSTIQWPWFKKRAIEIRRRASPIRFIRAVIMPAPSAVGVWK